MCAKVPALPLGKDGRTCNGYLPNSSTLDRYTWAVQWFVANGFYVLTDYHPMGMEWVQNDINKFVSSWKWVWGAIACLPNFSSDLKVRHPSWGHVHFALGPSPLVTSALHDINLAPRPCK